MDVLCCEAKDIVEINNTKEYTLTSTFLIERVLTDPRLTGCSSKLWQLLFNEARFNDNLEVEIPYSKLANRLGKSTRTICRTIKILVDHGYLQIENCFYRSGGQKANRISVRFPAALMTDAKKTKDRGKAKHIEVRENIHYVDFSVAEPMTACDKVVIGEGDISDRPNNIIKNNNKSNNNSTARFETTHVKEKNAVVVDKDFKIQELEQRIQTLYLQQKEAEVAWLNEIDASKKYDRSRQFGECHGDYETALQQLEQLKKQKHQTTQEKNKVSMIEENPEWMKNRVGDRTISEFTFKRLSNTLNQFNLSAEEKNKLTNEIIFEVRFGSLVKSNQTQHIMPIDYAVNVALKLVREGRWCAPSALKSFMQSTTI